MEYLSRSVEEVEIANADLRGAAFDLSNSGGTGRGAGHSDRDGHYGLFICSNRRTASRATIDKTRMIITSRKAPAHACRCQSS